MNGNIVGEEFEDYVFGQIGLRQSIHGKDNRTPEEMQFLSNNNSWVKLASPVFIEDGYGTERLAKIMGNSSEAQKFSGTELAKNSILFNGLNSLKGKTYEQRAGIVKNNSKLWNNAAYGLGGTDFGIQPFPQISDIRVDCINRGSIRKAEVNLTAFNQYQFEIIELLYLRLGYTVMLEWGNNKFFSTSGQYESVGNTLIEEFWFKDNGLTQLEVIQKINTYREKYQGNYDGFFGKVSNFSFNFNEDGTYSITLSLITIGDVIESIQANVPVKNYFREEELKVNEGDPDALKKSPLVTSATNNIFNAWMYTCIKTKGLWESSEGSSREYLNLHHEIRKVEKNTPGLDVNKLPIQYAYYVTFKELLEKVNEYIIPNIIAKGGDDTKGIKQLRIYKSRVNNYVNYFPNQISFDPRVCLIKPNIGGAGFEDIPVPEYLNNLPLNYTGIVNDVVVGQLMNIYINFDFISSCIKTAVINDKITLYKFLENLSSGINRALGGVNKIEPVIDNDNQIKFIDQTPIPGLNEQTPKSDIVDLEVFGYNNTNNTSNFVRNINFITKISPSLATQVTIGATAAGSVKNEDATAFSKWNKGLIDRFAEKFKTPSPKINPFNSEDDARRLEEDAEKEWKGFLPAQVEVTDYSKITRDGKYGKKLVNSRAYKDVPSKSVVYKYLDVSFGFSSKRATLEEYQRLYVDHFLKQTEKGAIEEHDFENIKKTDLGYYFAECFGGDVTYTVALKKVQTKPINAPLGVGVVGFGGLDPALPSNLKPTEKTDTDTITTRGIHRYIEYDSYFINRSSNIYESYLNTFYSKHYQNKDVPSPLIGFIPVSFNITLDGISGVKIYNKLNVSQRFLPKQYPEALKFIVTKVNHQVSGNEWTTDLETISIPNVNPNDYKQIWQKVGPLSADQLVALLPEEERGPQPKGDKLKILDNRKPLYIPNISEISVDELLKDFHPQARPSFTRFFKELENNYKGYTILVNSLQRDFTLSDSLNEENPANAAGGHSRHNYNTAIDFNVTTPKGIRLKKATGKNLWINHGFDSLAKKHGIKWGGTFDNYKDYVHFAWQDYSIEKAFRDYQSDVNSIKLEV